ncbi:MAG: hypothetical protein A2W05_06085 [Candidatus Schekmanbacteria bacterium RBG_16_38_10]|uniref:SMP-30/Gluconolactonase/LRE-like region domain-containing protein n=1 Tax=Candidatus Schekmanbacteria bacterium RBG_16_38_10 TaxID=1817879 RepID=A0A1F7RR44_9BACT|nr:MAG: hypothetical protein A2W05_06085 [Candidatus Schekmanbacteria bacterium RBG_16_38_10]
MKVLKSKIFFFLLFIFIAVEINAEVTVISIGGKGEPGLSDDEGSNARFNVPIRLACDKDGNIIVADIFNNCIRKISPKGFVSTIAGTKEGGYIDGELSKAKFGAPHGVGVDSKGNIFVADLGSSTIRKISTDKTVTTFAGSGKSGFKDGKGKEAELSFPHAIAIDSKDNLFIADISNHRIRKITPDGTVSTYAGSGEKGFSNGDVKNAKFNMPIDVTVDKEGNLYVADIGNQRIRKITAKGEVTTLAGNGEKGYADGKGENASFNGPHGIAVDRKGNIIVAELYNFVVRTITPDGNVSTLCGNRKQGDTVGTCAEAQFNQPGGVTIDNDGNIIIADLYNHKVKKIIIK